ncbi:MAG: hypothetical protein HQL52_02215 [Magnetococcales bacterium]|nr:hypothetical protein [Magnetococcales bacterium]
MPKTKLPQPGSDKNDSPKPSQRSPLEKPQPTLFARLLTGKPLEDQIIDPANPNLINKQDRE